MSLPVARGLENRTPREVFTRALRRMCERLDACSEFEITDKSIYAQYAAWAGYSMTEQVRITALWVAGSYARGAPTCGDLDTVIELHNADGKGRRVSHEKVVRPAFGIVANLQCQEGTPQKNTSGVPFGEAVQIWAPGMDWRAAIDAIPVDENAQRFERKGADLPLRTRQLRLYVGVREELIKQLQ